MLTICALRRRVRGGKSAMSLACRFVVPITENFHRQGNELKWWENIKIDALTAADRLWRQTRGATTADVPSTT
jgi:hypothetical protein